VIKIYKIPIILAIVLLMVPLINNDLDSGYFTLLRIIVCGAGIYLAIIAQSIKKLHWMWIIGFLAILFNPVIPVHLSKETWIGIDFISAVIFIVALFALTTKQNVFKIKAFQNTLIIISIVIGLFVALIGLGHFFPKHKETIISDKGKDLLNQGFDIKTAEPVVIVNLQGENVKLEYKKSVSDEEIKKAISVKFFDPALNYKDNDIIATLAKVYGVVVEKKYSTEKEKWLVFEIEIQAINNKKSLYYKGVLADMRDNYDNYYGLQEPWFYGFKYNMEILPKGDLKTGDIYPGDKGKIVLCADKKLLDNSTMLWIRIFKDRVCNTNEIVFKIPIVFVDHDLKEMIKKKNIEKKIELSETEDEKMFMPNFGEVQIKKRKAFLTEYSILDTNE